MSVTSENNPSFIVFSSDLKKIGRKLYRNEKTADVHFSFAMDDGTMKRVPAHKNILAAASDVFEAMFYGDLKEKGDVHLTDASEGAFMEFLQFFYLDYPKLTMKNIAGVMYLGHKYNITTCVDGCVRFLKDVLSVDNIFLGLNLAILYNQQELMKFCSNLITLNTAEVFQTDGFLECDRQALAHILHMDVLSCSEVEIFKACMAWVRAKSKQNTLTKAMVKKQLSGLFHEIRFKSMTVLELCALQKEYEAVLRADFTTLTNMIADAKFQADDFCNDQRHAKWNADGIISCDRKMIGSAKSSYNLLKNEITTFSSSEPLLLGSFVCGKIQFETGFHSHNLISDLPIEVKISEVSCSTDTSAKVLVTMRSQLQSIDANHIELPHSILIRPKLRYTISIGPFPAQHKHYSGELKKVVWLLQRECIQYTKVKFHDCFANDDNEVVGLISCLNFNPL